MSPGAQLAAETFNHKQVEDGSAFMAARITHKTFLCVCVCGVCSFVRSVVGENTGPSHLPTAPSSSPTAALAVPGLSPEVCRAPMLLHPACLSCALLLSPGSPDPPPQFLLTLFSLLMTPPRTRLPSVNYRPAALGGWSSAGTTNSQPIRMDRWTEH